MKLGIGTYAFSWSIGVPGYPVTQPMTAADLLERARALGTRVVQFADNLPLDQLPGKEQEDLRSRSREARIEIEIGARGFDLSYLRRQLELCRRFESRLLRVVVDSGGHRPDPEEVVVTSLLLLSELEDSGVRLAIENHDRFTVGQFRMIIERIDSPYVGICLDTVNSFGALEGPRTVVQELGNLVVNLHVKDFIVRRADHMMGFLIEGRPAGQGQLDIRWLLDELRSRARDFNLILELWPPPEASPDETARKERRWVEESLGYLRPMVAD